MNKKKWVSVSIRTIKLDSEDIITSSITVTPGENETPILPLFVE